MLVTCAAVQGSYFYVRNANHEAVEHHFCREMFYFLKIPSVSDNCKFCSRLGILVFTLKQLTQSHSGWTDIQRQFFFLIIILLLLSELS